MATRAVTQQILFHPRPIFYQELRPLCFCGLKLRKKVAECVACRQWYHWGCLGVSEKYIKAAKNWKCGYCREKPGADGMCEWKMDVSEDAKKKKKVAPARHVDDTPLARGVSDDGDEWRDVGLRAWADIVAAAKEGGKTINGKMLAMRKRAEKLVKEGGHHVVDQMSAVGLQVRGVDDTLVDDLMGQGLLPEADDPVPEIAQQDDDG